MTGEAFGGGEGPAVDGAIACAVLDPALKAPKHLDRAAVDAAKRFGDE